MCFASFERKAHYVYANNSINTDAQTISGEIVCVRSTRVLVGGSHSSVQYSVRGWIYTQRYGPAATTLGSGDPCWRFAVTGTVLYSSLLGVWWAFIFPALAILLAVYFRRAEDPAYQISAATGPMGRPE
jgi:hypothetical protein